VYCVNVISMMPENGSKYFPLPRRPLGRIVHGMCFSHDNVFSIRCIRQTVAGLPVAVFSCSETFLLSKLK